MVRRGVSVGHQGPRSALVRSRYPRIQGNYRQQATPGVRPSLGWDVGERTPAGGNIALGRLRGGEHGWRVSCAVQLEPTGVNNPTSGSAAGGG